MELNADDEKKKHHETWTRHEVPPNLNETGRLGAEVRLLIWPRSTLEIGDVEDVEAEPKMSLIEEVPFGFIESPLAGYAERGMTWPQSSGDQKVEQQQRQGITRL
ncbi:hypothetical protein ACFE04_025516 [Oxalis oulophora]